MSHCRICGQFMISDMDECLEPRCGGDKVKYALALLKEAGVATFTKERLHSDIQYLLLDGEQMVIIPAERRGGK